PAAVRGRAVGCLTLATGDAAADGAGGRWHWWLAVDRCRAQRRSGAAGCTARDRRMNRFVDSLRLTLRTVLTDRYAVVLMVGAVVLYSFFYPAAYRHQVASNLPIVVVDHDQSATSRELLRRVDALHTVRIVDQPASIDQARHVLE